MKKTVLILGAGPAGLAAAYKLLNESKDYKVIILEKQKEIGGLCKTIDFKQNKLDYGVHFYRISEYKEVNDIIYNLIPIEDNISIQLTKQEKDRYVKKNQNQENSDNIMLIKEATSNIYFDNKFYEYPIKINLDTIKKMGIINLIAIAFSYLKVLIFKKKETNLENYYINRYGKKFYSMFFLDYTKKVCGVDPKDIDIDWGKQRIRDTSLISIVKEKIFKSKKVNNEPSLIKEYYYPKYGCGQTYEKLVDKIIKLGGIILTNSYVKDIIIKDNKITKVNYFENKELKELEVDYLINSIALKDFVSLIRDDTASKSLVSEIQRLPFRDLILVNIILTKKDMLKLSSFQEIKENSWVFIQNPDVKFGRIKIANNWSNYMLKDKGSEQVLLTLEYCCDSKDPINKMTNDKLINQVKKELKLLKLYPKSGIKDYKITKVKNAYPAYYGVYSNRQSFINYLNKYKQIYFVGRNGQHQYIDMDKAMYTGLCASKEILNKTNNKKRVWL